MDVVDKNNGDNAVRNLPAAGAEGANQESASK